MRASLILPVVIALASNVFSQSPKLKSVNPETAKRQYKILELYQTVCQQNKFSDYYKVGSLYNIKLHAKDYTNKDAFDLFLQSYEKGLFSHPYAFNFYVTDEKLLREAKILTDLFRCAKDFETLYKTGAWARVNLNSTVFAYTFYVAFKQHKDTKDLALSAFYEIMPLFYAEVNVLNRIRHIKMKGLPFERVSGQDVVEDGDNFVVETKSDGDTYGQDESKLAYLTEDVGWNTYFLDFQANMQLWDNIVSVKAKARGVEYRHQFYKQLRARYLANRYSSGLGKIPDLSWKNYFQYSYRPSLSTESNPFVQRDGNFKIDTVKNSEDMRIVHNQELNFLSLLASYLLSLNPQVDFYNKVSVKFLGNSGQNIGKNNSYERSYEMAARRLLSGTHYSADGNFKLAALDFHQTSLRDPAFYQINNKILDLMQKQIGFINPHSLKSLQYDNVKIENVEISNLTTYFDFFRFNASNSVIFNDRELRDNSKSYLISQRRLNQVAFSVKINVTSDVDENVSFKVFIGPKYDESGQPVQFEDNWMNFIELDVFQFDLSKGVNIINRSSNEFANFKEDASSTGETYKFLSQGKVPVDMVEKNSKLSKRLVLPRGRKNGFPVQFFIMTYLYQAPSDLGPLNEFIFDDKPFGYPLDRAPIRNFRQMKNMYWKDSIIYHEGNEYP